MRYWVLLVGIVSWGVHGSDVLRAAVSTNFPDGLHTQYLVYLADKLHVDCEIGTMPYARRLLSVDNGDFAHIRHRFYLKQQEQQEQQEQQH